MSKYRIALWWDWEFFPLWFRALSPLLSAVQDVKAFTFPVEGWSVASEDFLAGILWREHVWEP